MLEQIAYKVPKSSERRQSVYEAKDLGSLSGVVLYTGNLPPMGPGGFGVPASGDSYGATTPIFTKDGTVSGDLLDGYTPPKIVIPNLTIRDFPSSGFQLHIHEGETTKASSLMDYSRRKHLVSSYDAAMADGGVPAYNAMERLNYLFSLPKVQKGLRELGRGRFANDK